MSLFLLDPFRYSPFALLSRNFFENGDNFELNLNIGDFKPEEISVKVTEDSFVVVEGKHGEKKDKNGSISRHFIKKCAIPSGFDTSKVTSKLYSDGILTVSVPRVQGERKSRNIPVQKLKSKL